MCRLPQILPLSPAFLSSVTQSPTHADPQAPLHSPLLHWSYAPGPGLQGQTSRLFFLPPFFKSVPSLLPNCSCSPLLRSSSVTLMAAPAQPPFAVFLASPSCRIGAQCSSLAPASPSHHRKPRERSPWLHLLSFSARPHTTLSNRPQPPGAHHGSQVSPPLTPCPWPLCLISCGPGGPWTFPALLPSLGPSSSATFSSLLPSVLMLLRAQSSSSSSSHSGHPLPLIVLLAIAPSPGFGFARPCS